MMEEYQSVHVLVLGDVTRSPRIRNHAISFASEGMRVKFSGYKGATAMTTEGKIAFSFITEPPPGLDRYLPRPLALLLKMIFLFFGLLFHLVVNFREDVLFVQSPPAVPLLIVVWLFALFKRCPVCIDWHNYGYTILEAASGRKTLASRMYGGLELNFASWFLNSRTGVKTCHFTVSKALQSDLFNQTGIIATVVYDKPTPDFKPTSAQDIHCLFTRLSFKYPSLGGAGDNQTVFTQVSGSSGVVSLRSDRPALVVSGCSWTPDDDFTIMLEALDIYNATVATSPNIQYHKLICAVTGRGPMKAHFEALIEQRAWSHVDVLTPWLEWADYPLLCGAADLGVSLHRSTSNLDLPMKIVDLLGCRVPVVALAYPALAELLPVGRAGYFFSTAQGLADHLIRLLMPKEDFEGVGDAPDLARCRRHLRDREEVGWHAHWTDTVLPECTNLLGWSKVRLQQQQRKRARGD